MYLVHKEMHILSISLQSSLLDNCSYPWAGVGSVPDYSYGDLWCLWLCSFPLWYKHQWKRTLSPFIVKKIHMYGTEALYLPINMTSIAKPLPQVSQIVISSRHVYKAGLYLISFLLCYFNKYFNIQSLGRTLAHTLMAIVLAFDFGFDMIMKNSLDMVLIKMCLFKNPT